MRHTRLYRDESIPQSIYEIEGAADVAVEFRSFSKTAGFTGTRCACTVVPKSCRVFDSNGNTHFLHPLWNRRHSTKFNGVSYPVQRAAEAVYVGDGPRQVRELSDYYMENARLIREKMLSLGFSCTGGTNAPYIWINCGMDSWKFSICFLKRPGGLYARSRFWGAEGYIR